MDGCILKLKLLENSVSNGNLILMNSVFSNYVYYVAYQWLALPMTVQQTSVRDCAEGCCSLPIIPQNYPERSTYSRTRLLRHERG